MRKTTKDSNRPEPPVRVKNYITPSGLQRLRDEHRFLLTRQRSDEETEQKQATSAMHGWITLGHATRRASGLPARHAIVTGARGRARAAHSALNVLPVAAQ